MSSFIDTLPDRNEPPSADRADRSENGIADAASTGHSAKGSSSLCPANAAPAYLLRGRFAARQTLLVPAELTLRDEPAPAPQLPRWYSLAAFLIMSSATLFAMCAMGRPGA